MKRDHLKEYFRQFYSGGFLVEQAEEEEPENDLFGGEDDAGDADTGDVPEDADDEAADDEGDTETEKEESEGVEIDPDDEVRYGKQLDQAVDSVLVDFETAALKTAAVETESQASLNQEGWVHRSSLSTLLFEQEETDVASDLIVTDADIDVDKFAQDVAHFIKNYDVLLDMEDIIFKKAFSFLEEKYGETVASAFEESLLQVHNLDFSSQSVEMTDTIEAPLAVGAGGGDSGGAL
jgi:hypothetical protein